MPRPRGPCGQREQGHARDLKPLLGPPGPPLTVADCKSGD